MTKPKHTPGPWKPLEERGRLYVVEQNQDNVTVCIVPDISDEASQADARLIASAPELLEALKFFVSTALDVDPKDVSALRGKALIIKAEGK